MGTHPNGPAHIYEQPETDLLSVIKSNPEHYLGQALIEEWPNTLQVPYLFKVLSIREALPLQAHPDVRLAQKLNKENEKEFVDANHKPEIAIAIGETLGHGTWGEDIAFTGFVGFKPLKDIQYSLETVEELRDAIGNQSLIQAFLTHPSQSTLKDVFGSLLTRGANDPDSVKSHISALLRKVQAIPGESISERALSKDTTNLLEKINNQYPGDVGIFATAFFMNFVKLKKGEAVYIGADEIHVYLEGGLYHFL